MTFKTRRVDYYCTTVRDEPGEAYRLLSALADLGINLLAFTAIPSGPRHTQLTVFPADDAKLEDAARKANIELDGPHPAIMAHGDDEIGAAAAVHEKLSEAGVNVFASNGISVGEGRYGYILHVRPEHYERATEALDI